MGIASVVQDILGERLMLALSLATIPGALLQLLTQVRPPWTLIVDALDWGVVFVFALEYSANLRLAPSKRHFVLGGWNLLNLFIILLALVGFVAAYPILYSAPLLRVIRATKLFTESARSSAELGR